MRPLVNETVFRSVRCLALQLYGPGVYFPGWLSVQESLAFCPENSAWKKVAVGSGWIKVIWWSLLPKSSSVLF